MAFVVFVSEKLNKKCQINVLTAHKSSYLKQ